ncbi:hypothetical protein ACFY5C_11655 [Streptomyces sp. NPDC012935]
MRWRERQLGGQDPGDRTQLDASTRRFEGGFSVTLREGSRSGRPLAT